MLTQLPDNDSSSMIPACFACHVDCATGCHTDDQPFDHPYAYHPPNFDEDNSNAGDEDQMLSSKFDDREENVNFDDEGDEATRGPVSRSYQPVPSCRGACGVCDS